jgi:hypothetical protein
VQIRGSGFGHDKIVRYTAPVPPVNAVCLGLYMISYENFEKWTHLERANVRSVSCMYSHVSSQVEI